MRSVSSLGVPASKADFLQIFTRFPFVFVVANNLFAENCCDGCLLKITEFEEKCAQYPSMAAGIAITLYSSYLNAGAET
jgi:hypothetical protein